MTLDPLPETAWRISIGLVPGTDRGAGRQDPVRCISPRTTIVGCGSACRGDSVPPAYRQEKRMRSLSGICRTLAMRAMIAALAVFLLGSRGAALADALDTTFLDPNITSTVNAVAVQDDGKILIGGGFIRVDGVARRFPARLNRDGSLDTGFVPPLLDNRVNAIAIQRDGNILVGGLFTLAGTSIYRRALRLDGDGTIDSTFADPNFDGNVNAIAINTDGTVLFGGAFTTIGTRSYGGLARYSSAGVVDPTFANPNFNREVKAIALTSDGKILAGGVHDRGPDEQHLRPPCPC